jgi:alanyl-tRNA synthetase
MALEQEYQIEFFEERGFQRKECPECGTFYWTLDPDREVCGDPPCVEYQFIGDPLTDGEHTLEEMRERFLAFLEERGHTRVERRPVAARWREDIYLTIASIADFQPHVTSGEAPPPANPLCVSQPCIRLNDLDSVGRSGRHLTTFEMMAHHAFNDPDEHHYFKDRTVELCHEFMTKSLGMDPQELTYIEKPWAGGGNAGPAFEVVIGGLEVATLVFMNLEEDPDGDIELYGDTYSRMDLEIVDTGYGLERLVWASNGAPTVYDAIYPDVVEELLEMAGLAGHREDPRVQPVLEEVARLSSIMDVVDTDAKLDDLRSTVHQRIEEDRPDLDITEEELRDILEPLEAVYAVADHTRCLAFMLGDGIVPSNVKAGYLVRLVARRTLRLMDELGIEESLADLVDLQLDALDHDFPELKRRRDVIRTILDLETERFRETLETGKRLVRQEARSLEGDVLGSGKLVEFYDSQGIPPDIVTEVAAREGVEVDVPDDFYKQVAQRHAGDGGPDRGEGDDLAQRLPELPETETLYYENGGTRDFEAVVQWSDDEHVVLDQTAFYPEGGGQPPDTGHILADNKTLEVTDVQKVDGGVIVHEVDGELGTGDMVTGRVDWGKRMAHTRHHTATHIIIGAARNVLGDHAWQAGAQKGARRSRIDLTHFRRITDEEIRQIEQLANMVVLDNHAVEKLWMRRDEAENKYGVILYQGGIPRGEDVRVVRITDFDVEYCAGTHVNQTSDVGPIKILDTERVQDGIVRIHFSAGLAAVREGRRRDQLLEEASGVFDVPIDELPGTAQRFFDEWKEYRKQVEDLQEQLAELKTEVADTETVAGREVLFRFPDEDLQRDELQAELTTFVNEGDDRVAVGATPAGDAIVCASDGSGVDCAAVFDALADALGGKGGGGGTMAQGRLDKVDAEAAREAALGVLEG